MVTRTPASTSAASRSCCSSRWALPTTACARRPQARRADSARRASAWRDPAVGQDRNPAVRDSFFGGMPASLILRSAIIVVDVDRLVAHERLVEQRLHAGIEEDDSCGTARAIRVEKLDELNGNGCYQRCDDELDRASPSCCVQQRLERRDREHDGQNRKGCEPDRVVPVDRQCRGNGGEERRDQDIAPPEVVPPSR